MSERFKICEACNERRKTLMERVEKGIEKQKTANAFQKIFFFSFLISFLCILPMLIIKNGAIISAMYFNMVTFILILMTGYSINKNIKRLSR